MSIKRQLHKPGPVDVIFLKPGIDVASSPVQEGRSFLVGNWSRQGPVSFEPLIIFQHITSCVTQPPVAQAIE